MEIFSRKGKSCINFAAPLMFIEMIFFAISVSLRVVQVKPICYFTPSEQEIKHFGNAG